MNGPLSLVHIVVVNVMHGVELCFVNVFVDVCGLVDAMKMTHRAAHGK